MTRKRALVVVVRIFALVGVVAFSIPFVGVFFGGAPGEQRERTFVDFADLVVGEPRVFELSPIRPLIVLRADPRQRRDLAVLSAHVWDPGDDVSARDLFVHWGLSTGKFGGCRLQHKPAVESREPAASTGSQWLGGYWAPGCEASYDYAGRAIKTPRHAYGNYVERSRALRSPEIELLNDGRLAITINAP